MKHIARLILKIFGWKLKGGLPADKKAVVISVPHTSIMDFIWGKLTFISQGVPTYILMKKEFFFFPLGPILKALNVIPVDRGNKENHIVERMVEEFKKRDVMYLTITPEGSRKKRKKWKKGFLVIAKEAGVPVYLGRIDYKDKYYDYKYNTEENALYLGGGYMQRIRNNSFMQLGLMYNVLWKQNSSVFSSGLVPTIGFVVGL